MTVYLIKNPRENAVKIGYTDGDPMDRLRSLQTGSPSVLYLIDTIEDAPRDTEQELHARFTHLRVRRNGEWFHDDGSILSAFESHRAAEHREHLLTAVRELESKLLPALETAPEATTGQLTQLLDSMLRLAVPRCSCVGTSTMSQRLYAEVGAGVQNFWDEFRNRFAWDLLPYTFLYDLYKAWFSRVTSSGSVVGSHKFADKIREIVEFDSIWTFSDQKRAIYAGLKMEAPEPLVVEYQLLSWCDQSLVNSRSPNPVALSQPKHLRPNYRGLTRRHPEPMMRAAQLTGATTSTPITTTSEEN